MIDAGDERHWQGLRQAVYLGYRPWLKQKGGTWYARFYDADANRNARKGLGTGPIRANYQQAFEAAKLAYFKPHCSRDKLTALGMRICRPAEEFKAWSQNLGHKHVLTTFACYGKVPSAKQAELIRGLGRVQPPCH